jgi:hypothetical protein
MAGLTELVEERENELIIWDTLSRMLPGADENATKEMSLVVDALDRLRFDVGCGSLALHHSVKNGLSARGVSPYLGACDTELQLVAEDQEVTLSVLQQRDADRTPDIRLWREMVPNTSSATIVDGWGKVATGLSTAEKALLLELHKAQPNSLSLPDLLALLRLPRETVRKAGLDLEAAGFLQRGSRGNTTWYTLTTRGQQQTTF